MKKVLLISEQGIIYEASPARYQLVYELKQAGYETYVFHRGRITCSENRRDIDHFTDTRNLSMEKIRKKILEINPDYVIASTDGDTTLLFPILSRMAKTFFIYYNLEIYTPDRAKRLHGSTRGKFDRVLWKVVYLQEKLKEIYFTRKCSLFIIQDTLRKEISKKYFIAHPNTMLIPNSYIYEEKNYGGNSLSGVVYSGVLKQFRAEEMMKALQKMPDFPIAFSGTCDKWFRKQFRILSSSHPAMQLFEQSLPPEKHLQFLKQYAVGLVWYDHYEDDNEEYIGLASGKLFRHLSIGQPVIVSNSQGLAKVIHHYKVGLVIDDLSELPEAYQKIMDNYFYYQNRVKQVYKAKFDFSKNIKSLLEDMRRMR